MAQDVSCVFAGTARPLEAAKVLRRLPMFRIRGLISWGPGSACEEFAVLVVGTQVPRKVRGLQFGRGIG